VLYVRLMTPVLITDLYVILNVNKLYKLHEFRIIILMDLNAQYLISALDDIQFQVSPWSLQ